MQARPRRDLLGAIHHRDIRKAVADQSSKEPLDTNATGDCVHTAAVQLQMSAQCQCAAGANTSSFNFPDSRLVYKNR